MARRIKHRVRERGAAPLALQALRELVPSDVNARKFLTDQFVGVPANKQRADTTDSTQLQEKKMEERSAPTEEDQGDCIFGEGLTRFLQALNKTTFVTSAVAPGNKREERDAAETLTAENATKEECEVYPITHCGVELKAEDILSITRRVPRSRSTVNQIEVPELCFALHQISVPVDIHARRQLAGERRGATNFFSPECLVQEDEERQDEEQRAKRRKVDEHEERGTFSKPLCEDLPSHKRPEKLDRSWSEEVEEWSMTQYYKRNLFERLIVSSYPPTLCSSPDGVPPEKENANWNDDVEKEWRRFVSSLSFPLPMTLRIHRNEKLLQHVAHVYLRHHTPLTSTVKPASMVTLSSSGFQKNKDSFSLSGTSTFSSPFLPSPAVDVFGCSDADYHHHKTVEYICRTLHGANAVSFQEIVSMLPVLALDVQPHHRVLDLCAAPGSKTLHALDEMLGNGWTGAAGHGVLIANEKDRVKATQTLPARLKRYHAPNVLAICCDGTQWPRVYTHPFYQGGQKQGKREEVMLHRVEQEWKKQEAPAGNEVQEKDVERKEEQGDEEGFSGSSQMEPTSMDDDEDSWGETRFDRIICDVPCSGDGTIRKEPSIATTWSSKYVELLVPTQISLLRRGLDLLDVGGVLVYSTCSLNPKEDEEVVASALAQVSEGEVELLNVNEILAAKGIQLHSYGGMRDPSHRLPLPRSNKKTRKETDSTPASPESTTPASSSVSSSSPSLPTSSALSAYDGTKVLRVWPHRDNTGGFFIAAFRKRRLAPLTPPAKIEQKLNEWMKGKLWAPVSPKDEEWRSILSFYFDAPSCGDASAFPYREDLFRYLIPIQLPKKRAGQLRYSTEQGWKWWNSTFCSPSAGAMTRLIPVFHLNPHGGPSRRIVLVTEGVAKMLFGSKPYKGPGVEVVCAGVRAFEKYDAKFLPGAVCRWRVTLEALSFLAPHLSRRTLRLRAAPCLIPSEEEGAAPVSSPTTAHGRMVESLLRDGYVPLYQYWPELFGCSSYGDRETLSRNGGVKEDETRLPSAVTTITPSTTPSSTAAASGMAAGLVVDRSPLAMLLKQVQDGIVSREVATEKIWNMDSCGRNRAASSSVSLSTVSSSCLSSANDVLRVGEEAEPRPATTLRKEQEEEPQAVKQQQEEDPQGGVSSMSGSAPQHSFLDELLIGGINVEIRWDPTVAAASVSSSVSPNSPEIVHPCEPWRLSATLSRYKLELAVDELQRTFGLMYFCGIQTAMRSSD